MNKRTIIITDCGSGLAIALLGTFATTPETIGQTWWLVVVTAALTGVATYVDEQRLGESSVRRRVSVYAAAAAGLATLVGVAVATAGVDIAVAMTLAVVGFGIATLVNRVVFGIVYPIPTLRLERAEQYSL